jgi:hypothetical protein
MCVYLFKSYINIYILIKRLSHKRGKAEQSVTVLITKVKKDKIMQYYLTRYFELVNSSALPADYLRGIKCIVYYKSNVPFKEIFLFITKIPT